MSKTRETSKALRATITPNRTTKIKKGHISARKVSVKTSARRRSKTPQSTCTGMFYSGQQIWDEGILVNLLGIYGYTSQTIFDGLKTIVAISPYSEMPLKVVITKDVVEFSELIVLKENFDIHEARLAVVALSMKFSSIKFVLIENKEEGNFDCLVSSTASIQNGIDNERLLETRNNLIGAFDYAITNFPNVFAAYLDEYGGEAL